MSNYYLFRFSVIIRRLEYTISQLFGRGFPPEAPCIAAVQHGPLEALSSPQQPRFSLKDLIGNGILWAVPKHRRSIEKRLKRKYGCPEYFLKILKPKANLRVCHQCGHDHEVGVLCHLIEHLLFTTKKSESKNQGTNDEIYYYKANCYKKIKEETEQMQEKIQDQLGLNPVEQEVVVLYDGERNEQPSEFLNGKRIIEMKKPRPMWFHKNLMQKSTQQPATTKDVKPNELG